MIMAAVMVLLLVNFAYNGIIKHDEFKKSKVVQTVAEEQSNHNPILFAYYNSGNADTQDKSSKREELPPEYTVIKFYPDNNHFAVLGGIERDIANDIIRKFKDGFSTDKPFVILNDRLPDAEKFSLVWQTSSVQTENIMRVSPSEIEDMDAALELIAKGVGDTTLCWAESCSDMLMIAGWAQKAIDPYSGKKFATVDMVSDYYTKNFIDKGGTAFAGIDYFITGSVNYPEMMEAVVKVNAQSVSMFPGVITDNVAGYYDWLDGEPFDENNFISLLKVIDNGGAAGIDIAIIEEQGFGKHAVTIGGYVLDEKTGKLSHLAIINSDNDALDYKDEDCTQYDTLEDAERDPSLRKENRIDTYTVYPVEYEEYNNREYLSLSGYSTNEDEKIIIVDMTTLEHY